MSIIHIGMSLTMTRRAQSLAALLLGVLIAGSFMWLIWNCDTDPSLGDQSSSPALIKRGKYLTEAADCAACHNAPNGAPFSGGLAFKLPFGTLYSTNITPDRTTGIGTWSDNDFVRALHEGVAKGGRYLYPAFPYTSYSAMSRDDAIAIKAYLFSITPVYAPPRPNNFPFPFNQRWTMFFWNLLFLNDHRFHALPSLTASQNRGAYLATALGHCGECHTPRNLGFGLKSGDQFAGAMIEGWHAYNITSDKKFGVGGWSDAQLATYLSTGHADEHGSASGPMADVVGHSLQFLTPTDAMALTRYLLVVPDRNGPRDVSIATSGKPRTSSPWSPNAAESTNNIGQSIFEGVCASCHLWDGQGEETNYAELLGSPAVNDPDAINLIQVLLNGTQLKVGRQTFFMPAFGDAYSDTELAAVANYVIEKFSGKAGQVTREEVHSGRNT